MGENKKYYWLKLKDSFFRDKEIKKLRKIAGGDTYTIIYLKLQLLSLKKEGKLKFDNLEDTFSDEMALELDESTENVKVTLMYLQKCGLIEEVAKNEFMLPQAIKSIGTETQGAERMRRCRERKELSQCDVQVLLSDATVTNSDTERREKIEEKELDIDTDELPISKNLIEEVWKLYPNKKGKSVAIKKIPKILKDYSLEDIKKMIDRYITYVEGRQNTDFKNFKYQDGSTFFNGGYMDYLEDEEVAPVVKPYWENVDG